MHVKVFFPSAFVCARVYVRVCFGICASCACGRLPKCAFPYCLSVTASYRNLRLTTYGQTLIFTRDLIGLQHTSQYMLEHHQLGNISRAERTLNTVRMVATRNPYAIPKALSDHTDLLFLTMDPSRVCTTIHNLV